MPTILLIRHAENNYVSGQRLAGRLPGVHLNEKGYIQTQNLVARLQKLPIKAIYSSPLERAIETAEPIGQALNLEVSIRQGLNEVDYGDWQGKTLKSLSRRKLWRTVQAFPSRMRFPGGESFADAQWRVSQELEKIARSHSHKEMLVCVSHSDLIKLAVAYFIGLPIDMFQRLNISPASITILRLGDMGASLWALNYESSITLPGE